MRKYLYGLILLGTTALYPAPAYAMPPVVGFIGGIITAIGAPGIGGAIAGAFGGFSAGAFAAGYAIFGGALGGFLLQTALSLGISALAQALRPRPDAPPNPGARLVNMRQPITHFEHVYGVVRKGGPVAFWQAKNGRRYYDVVLAARRINGVRQWFADETEVRINANGYSIDKRFQGSGNEAGSNTSRLRLRVYPNGGVPAWIKDGFPEVTDEHNFAGLAHLVAVAQTVEAEQFSEVYPTGREPVISPVIEGYLCYDPRDSSQSRTNPNSWKFTENAALIIADWITSKDGLEQSVNWDKVAVEADICDETILDRDGNEVKRWTLGGVYSAADDRETTRANMGLACDAFFYEDIDGTVGFHVGRYIQPSVTIEDNDIISIQYSEGQPGTDLANAFTVEYTEPDIGYREAASAPYAVAYDPAKENYEEDSLRVYWVPNHNQAVRVAKRLLVTSRAKYRISGTLKYHGIRLVAQRFFRLRHLEFGGLDQVFEVDRLKRNDDGITWTIEAHSVTPQDFAFDSFTEEPEKPKRTTIQVDNSIAAPTGVSAVSQPFAGSVGIYVSWNAPSRDNLLHQVRYRMSLETEPWTTINVPFGQTHQNIVGLLDNIHYDVQVRAMTNSGKGSNWAPSTPITVLARVDPNPPGVPTGVNAIGGSGEVELTWKAPNSGNYFATQIFRNTVDDINTSSMVVTEYGSPNVNDDWTDTGLSAGTYYYWLVAINQSGVRSGAVPTGPVTVT